LTFARRKNKACIFTSSFQESFTIATLLIVSISLR
jgi:hypothetical protein